MIALTLWLLAIAMADLPAGTREEPVSRGRPVIAGSVLLVVAVGGSYSLGFASDTAIVVAAGVALSGVLWLKLAGYWALGSLGLSIVLLLVFGGLAEPSGRGLYRFLDDSMLVAEVPPEAVVLVAAMALFLIATGNTIVRVTLRSIEGNPLQGEASVKGGRVIGPLERLLIYGLGLAGQLTAVGFVVAAKSLLRLSDPRGDNGGSAPAEDAPNSEVRSEYIVVGSLVSWSVALAGIGLTALGLRLT